MTKSKPERRRGSVRRAYTLLAPYLLQHRARIGVAMACLFLAVAMRIIEPWPLQYVLDHVLVAQLIEQNVTEQNVTGQNVQATDANIDSNAGAILMVCAIVIILTASLRALFDYTRVVSFAWIGNRVVTQLRRDVFQHLQSLSLRFHAKSRSGDLTVRLVGDLNMIRDVAVTALLPMVASVVILFGMSAIMLWMQWRLAVMAIAIFPLFWLAATRSSRKIHQAAKAQRSCEGALAATANESLSSVKVVQALSLENHFADSFAAQSQKSMKDGVKTSRLSAALERKVDVLIALASALVLWQGARFVLTGELTIGGLVVFLAYLKRGFKPLQDFAKYTGRISKALAAADRVMEILDESPDVRERPDAVPAPRLVGKVEFRNVSFHYHDGTPILRNVSFTIEPGRRVAIVGTSGAGKSTLLSLISRLYDPSEGQLVMDGTDIRDWTLASLRSQQSIVMQDNAIFATTVRENIAIIGGELTDDEIVVGAKRAGAHDFITQLPDGYQTVIGERGANLSRGQAQRLAIARATVRPLPIFLVDEPTTGLDVANERLVVDGILKASAGRTTLVVTHQMELASQCDTILVLHNGQISEQGSHAELIQHDGIYAEMYQSQRGQSESRRLHNAVTL